MSLLCLHVDYARRDADRVSDVACFLFFFQSFLISRLEFIIDVGGYIYELCEEASRERENELIFEKFMYFRTHFAVLYHSNNVNVEFYCSIKHFL